MERTGPSFMRALRGLGWRAKIFWAANAALHSLLFSVTAKGAGLGAFALEDGQEAAAV
jgi:hypothetical protein